MKYQITKRNKEGTIFTVIEDTDKDMSDHVSACFKFTDIEILAIIRIDIERN